MDLENLMLKKRTASADGRAAVAPVPSANKASRGSFGKNSSTQDSTVSMTRRRMSAVAI